MSKTAIISDTSGVRTITMNRPDKKNAMSHDMYAIMADAIVSAEADPAIKVMIITGAADCFTSGNDLGDFMAAPPDLNASDRPPVSRFMFALLEAQKPVIAAIEGPAVGIGVTMLLHCDFAYAGKQAYFLTPFVNLALPPEYASTLLLPFAVGPKKANEMLMLGEKVSAKAAAKMGLITATTDTGKALETANKTALKLAAKAPEAMRLTKQLLGMGPEAPVSRMNRESALFAERLQSAEFKESVAAFFEKRDPDYTNCTK
ncbi:Enoyl-CoA hydratase [hydrothermal vent metagenome]|uniref:Enoyl-CoA hydratase n=1 Tax=hydrothermal vent metagenome TaxID=652676 RepID=A0A3B0RJW5_9ZZZZ